MATLWTGYYSYRSIKLLGPGLTLDVEVATIKTVPTGILSTYGIPIASWGGWDAASPGGQLLTTIAQQIEEMVAGNHVVGGSPSQDRNPTTNLLDDYQDLIVELRRDSQNLPPLQGTAHFLMQDFFNAETGIGGLTAGELPTTVVDNVYQQLEALAAGA